MTLTTAKYLTAPVVTPLKGTLLDAATVSSDFEWLDGQDLFDSYNCLTFDAEATFCGPMTKDLSQSAGWVDGVRFGAYGGVTCKAVGVDRDDMKRRVEQAFLAGESTAVEAGLMKYRFAANLDNDATLPGSWDAPVDITPAAGPVKPATGVAMLEGYAARNYAGEPTLHLPRTVASMLVGVDGAIFSGRVLNTKLGSIIAAGPGYDFPNLGPTGAEPAAGEKWLYATGAVVIGHTDVIVRDGFNQTDNDYTVLAERGYIVAVDCFAAAIRVNLTA